MFKSFPQKYVGIIFIFEMNLESVNDLRQYIKKEGTEQSQGINVKYFATGTFVIGIE